MAALGTDSGTLRQAGMKSKAEVVAALRVALGVGTGGMREAGWYDDGANFREAVREAMGE